MANLIGHLSVGMIQKVVNGMTEAQMEQLIGNYLANHDVTTFIEVATESTAGIVKPDGTTITVDSDGTVHAIVDGVDSGIITTVEELEELANTTAAKVTILENNIGEISEVQEVSDEEVATLILQTLRGNSAGSNEVSVTDPHYTDKLRFKGKKFIMFGDSMTNGNKSSPVGISDNPIYKQLAEKFGCTVVNEGIPGGTLAGNGNALTSSSGVGDRSIADRIGSTLASNTDTDYILVWAGFNDWRGHDDAGTFAVPLGTKNDAAGANTFYGGLKKILNTIFTTYPGMSVLFVTPIQTTAGNSGKANFENVPLVSFVDAMIEVCADYGVPCLDWYRTSGISNNGTFASVYMADGIHPNDELYKKLSEKLAQFITLYI